MPLVPQTPPLCEPVEEPVLELSPVELVPLLPPPDPAPTSSVVPSFLTTTNLPRLKTKISPGFKFDLYQLAPIRASFNSVATIASAVNLGKVKLINLAIKLANRPIGIAAAYTLENNLL